MKRLLVALIFTCMIGISYHASAALVQTDNYQSDTITGLDWLDLDDTFGQTRSNALLNNAGWRFATNGEVEQLSRTLFPDISSNAQSVVRYGTNGYVNNFLNTFGYRSTYGPIIGSTIYGRNSYGTYIDEDGQLRILGAIDNYACGWDKCNWVVGLEYVGRFNYPHSTIGTFLVRETVVPIPAAIWLFGTGLIGLVAVARRKAT